MGRLPNQIPQPMLLVETTMKDQTTDMVDQLIEAICKKLEANRSILARSIRAGRISWHHSKKIGEIVVDLEPKL